MCFSGGYTHCVANSNSRILDIEDRKVRFQCKDYRRGGQLKPMTLNVDWLIRRGLIQVRPSGFVVMVYSATATVPPHSPVVPKLPASRGADKDYALQRPLSRERLLQATRMHQDLFDRSGRSQSLSPEVSLNAGAGSR